MRMPTKIPSMMTYAETGKNPPVIASIVPTRTSADPTAILIRLIGNLASSHLLSIGGWIINENKINEIAIAR